VESFLAMGGSMAGALKSRLANQKTNTARHLLQGGVCEIRRSRGVLNPALDLLQKVTTAGKFKESVE
jgi:hypothetical protein